MSSEHNITKIINWLRNQMGIGMDAATQRLMKTPQSKNITISDWNDAIEILGTDSLNVASLYTAFSKLEDELVKTDNATVTNAERIAGANALINTLLAFTEAGAHPGEKLSEIYETIDNVAALSDAVDEFKAEVDDDRTANGEVHSNLLELITTIQEFLALSEGTDDPDAEGAPEDSLTGRIDTKVSAHNENPEAHADLISSTVEGVKKDVEEALKDYVLASEKGAAGGIATLDGDCKIPSSQLPAYVDDVLEYDSIEDFPTPAEGSDGSELSGKIYVALDSNKTYRWSGSQYTEISASITIGTTEGTAFPGLTGHQHVTSKSNPHSVSKTQVGLGNVANTGDSDTPAKDGTHKFTTGGAYDMQQSFESKLADKLDKKSISVGELSGDEVQTLTGGNIGFTKEGDLVVNRLYIRGSTDAKNHVVGTEYKDSNYRNTFATKQQLDDYVQKEEGKGLSTNDFTSELKSKLVNMTPGNYALKSDIPDVSKFITSVPSEYVTESELDKKNYALKSDIPTNVSELTNDANYAVQSDIPSKTSDLTNDSEYTSKSYVAVEIADAISKAQLAPGEVDMSAYYNKNEVDDKIANQSVATVSSKGLMSADDKAKLDSSLQQSDVLDGLGYTSTVKPLSSNQGRVLKGMIDDLAKNVGNTDKLNGLDVEYIEDLVEPEAGIKGYKISKIEYRKDPIPAEGYVTIPPSDTTNYYYAKLYLNRMLDADYPITKSNATVKNYLQIDLKNHFYDRYVVSSIGEGKLTENGPTVSTITVRRADGKNGDVGPFIEKNFVLNDDTTNSIENWCYMIGYSHGDPVKQSLGAVAGGEDTIVTGRGAGGFGRGHRVLGAYGFAGGRENTTGYGASAFGRENTSYGDVSFIAGGYKNLCDHGTKYSFIGGGQENKMYAEHSSILGTRCEAPKGLSNVRLFGYGLKANKADQVVYGKFNQPDDFFEAMWGIGNTEDTRDNGMAMSWDGNLYLKGNVYVGGVSESNKKKLISASDIPVATKSINGLMSAQDKATLDSIGIASNSKVGLVRGDGKTIYVNPTTGTISKAYHDVFCTIQLNCYNSNDKVDVWETLSFSYKTDRGVDAPRSTLDAIVSDLAGYTHSFITYSGTLHKELKPSDDSDETHFIEPLVVSVKPEDNTTIVKLLIDKKWYTFKEYQEHMKSLHGIIPSVFIYTKVG